MGKSNNPTVHKLSSSKSDLVGDHYAFMRTLPVDNKHIKKAIEDITNEINRLISHYSHSKDGNVKKINKILTTIVTKYGY